MRCTRPSLRLKIRFRARDVAAADLLADLRRVARRQRDRAPTMRAYNAAGRYRAGTLVRRFGSWTGALKAARLPVRRRWRVPEAVLLANLGRVWRRLGRQPTWRDLTLHDGRSRFAGSTYKARFGSWHKALIAFERHARAKRPLSASRDRSTEPARSRGPRDVGWRLRARVLIRDNCLCRMCGASPAKDPAVTLHVDHVVPWSKGGRTALENLQTLCERCNIGKGDAKLSGRPQSILSGVFLSNRARRSPARAAQRGTIQRKSRGSLTPLPPSGSRKNKMEPGIAKTRVRITRNMRKKRTNILTR